MRFIDLTGLRFGRLRVISCVENHDNGRRSMWLCECGCGNKIELGGWSLKSGHTKSCGCYKIEQVKKAHITHGMTGTKIYKTWTNMMTRCYRKDSNSYKWYGGRGIKVCKRWLKSPVFFLKDMGHPPFGLTLERMNNSKGYSPRNCKWATMKEQQNNRRNNT